MKHVICLLFVLILPPYFVLAAPLEELIVPGDIATKVISLEESRYIGPDSADILREAVGANVNSNGPLTGIAQYRGMYGDRIQVQVDGAQISSGGPNSMDPPLSYAPAALLESIKLYRDIPSVSAGQETIGGAIHIEMWLGEFATHNRAQNNGRLRIGGESVNDSHQLNLATTITNRRHRLMLSVLDESADHASFPEGELLPTEYERERYDIAYGFTRSQHTLQLNLGRNRTGDSGTPSLPMDIDYIDSDLANLTYQSDRQNRQTELNIYASDIEHGMTNYLLRQAPAAGSMWRRNIATAENRGFKLATKSNRWKWGFDYHSALHNSDIDNPNNANFFVINFNDAERDILGVFAEYHYQNKSPWSAEIGLRYNRVDMDAKTVDATPAMMGMIPAQNLRDQFNSANRETNENNVDWLVKLFHEKHNTKVQRLYYLGIAQKNRSPSYQERYLWLPLEATAGLADGRTYTGKLALEPETSLEIELGVDLKNKALSLSPRLFYRDIDDYIQGIPSTNAAAIAFVSMMNINNGTNNPPPLEFNNTAAEIYGFDIDWTYRITNQAWLNGTLNYARGKRKDISDNLYRLAPPNAFFAANYQVQKLLFSVSAHAYNKQDKVSLTNAEQTSAGYTLLNIKGQWQISRTTRLDFGVNNIGNKLYHDHLGGYNRVSGNPDIPTLERLPASGRSVFLSAQLEW